MIGYLILGGLGVWLVTRLTVEVAARSAKPVTMPTADLTAQEPDPKQAEWARQILARLDERAWHRKAALSAVAHWRIAEHRFYAGLYAPGDDTYNAAKISRDRFVDAWLRSEGVLPTRDSLLHERASVVVPQESDYVAAPSEDTRPMKVG